MWDVPPYSLVERYKRFGATFYLHLQGKNVTALLFIWETAGSYKALVHIICARLNGVTAKETNLFTADRT